jgi:hypothetical protein
MIEDYVIVEDDVIVRGRDVSGLGISVGALALGIV